MDPVDTCYFTFTLVNISYGHVLNMNISFIVTCVISYDVIHFFLIGLYGNIGEKGIRKLDGYYWVWWQVSVKLQSKHVHVPTWHPSMDVVKFLVNIILATKAKLFCI